ncbi:hypothetical protein M408DRAFT_28713 [Serendipita vermifera MAFF 305830]|uniref:Uncharacterized protein n=1 Tax=Serendipita vermifera MAFF 305830 TaxID=933852 RepID=A0A0C2WYT8_SERVB|nr:hypothetical protein M408DRAFT_28713 [Serendipita vermifera MAFF 305830]
MKLISFVTFAATLIAPAFADFHIQNCAHTYGLGGQSETTWPVIATPSNKWNCDGFRNQSPVVDGTDGLEDKESSVFSVKNLCGYKKLNFYPSGSEIKVYVDSGNGQQIGRCVKGGGGSKSCAAAFDMLTCNDDWVCLSTICS